MARTILFSSTATEKRAALLEDRRLIELVVERPDQFRILGNIYRGKVVSLLPGIQSAFVDIGMEQAAFLHASDVDPALFADSEEEVAASRDFSGRGKRRRIVRRPIEQVLSVGQHILVQVIKEPIGTKSPKVSTQISIAGRFIVLVPDDNRVGVSKNESDPSSRKKLKKLIEQLKPPGVGIIVRTIGTKVAEKEFTDELRSIIDTWKKVQSEALEGSGPRCLHTESGIAVRVIRDLFSDDVAEVQVDHQTDYQEILAYIKTASPHLVKRVHLYREDAGLFDKYDIEKEIDKSLRRKVWLKSGGYLLFDHAEALLAIDVNTGRNVGKKDVEDTIYKTNLEAAIEICRQLRLRDIGGIIVVDFIDMRDAGNRKKIEDEMEKLLEKDNTATSHTPISKFGLMELTRKRVRPELAELFTDVCPSCNGVGRVFSPATVTARIDRWLTRAEAAGMAGDLKVVVAPAVAEYIHKNHDQILRGLRKTHKFTITIIEDDDFDADEFEIFSGGSAEPVTEKFA